jgi:hypothetical protein
MKPRIFLTIGLYLSILATGSSQTILNPNYGLKSHETLEITRIEVSAEKTVVYLTIENRIENGTFCADRNIYLTDPSGTRLKVIKATGIPVCPDSYKFKKSVERLDFSLIFSPLKPGTVVIDLKEECADFCFSFYSIVLDKNLNSQLEEAFGLAESGQSLKALDKFITLAEVNQNIKGIAGIIYFNIVKIASGTGNSAKAGEWYRKLNSEGVPGGRIYIEQLNQQGIRY